MAQEVELKLSQAEAQTFTPANFSCRVLFYPRVGPGEHLKQEPANIWPAETSSKPAGSAPEAAFNVAVASQSNRANQPARDWIETDTNTAATLDDGRARQQAGNQLKLHGRTTPAVSSQSDCEHAPGSSKEPIPGQATGQKMTMTSPSAADASNKIPSLKLLVTALE